MTTFAINGFGRIGRALARIAHRREGLELVAVNDLMPAPSLARRLARDSVHGLFDADVAVKGDQLEIDGRAIKLFREADPAALAWPGGLDVVVEATGVFTRRDAAAKHLRDVASDPTSGQESHQGPRRVLVSAIVDDADLDLTPGRAVEARRLAGAQVLSALSCTSHCLALVLDVLDVLKGGPGVERALMNEVHSYTADQRLLDGDHADPRRARSAAINIVPTRSAAPRAVSRLVPELAGRLDGMAVRVPTPAVALLELVAVLETESSADQLRTLYRDAAAGPLAGLLAVSDEPLVSSDVVGEASSALVDLELISCNADLCRIVAWYDNEWGYAHRLADMLSQLAL